MDRGPHLQILKVDAAEVDEWLNVAAAVAGAHADEQVLEEGRARRQDQLVRANRFLARLLRPALKMKPKLRLAEGKFSY
jgi:hypothetical protein